MLFRSWFICYFSFDRDSYSERLCVRSGSVSQGLVVNRLSRDSGCVRNGILKQYLLNSTQYVLLDCEKSTFCQFASAQYSNIPGCTTSAILPATARSLTCDVSSQRQRLKSFTHVVSRALCVICFCKFGMFKLGGPWSKGPRVETP